MALPNASVEQSSIIVHLLVSWQKLEVDHCLSGDAGPLLH